MSLHRARVLPHAPLQRFVVAVSLTRLQQLRRQDTRLVLAGVELGWRPAPKQLDAWLPVRVRVLHSVAHRLQRVCSYAVEVQLPVCLLIHIPHHGTAQHGSMDVDAKLQGWWLVLAAHSSQRVLLLPPTKL